MAAKSETQGVSSPTDVNRSLKSWVPQYGISESGQVGLKHKFENPLTYPLTRPRETVRGLRTLRIRQDVSEKSPSESRHLPKLPSKKSVGIALVAGTIGVVGSAAFFVSEYHREAREFQGRTEAAASRAGNEANQQIADVYEKNVLIGALDCKQRRDSSKSTDSEMFEGEIVTLLGSKIEVTKQGFILHEGNVDTGEKKTLYTGELPIYRPGHPEEYFLNRQPISLDPGKVRVNIHEDCKNKQ